MALIWFFAPGCYQNKKTDTIDERWAYELTFFSVSEAAIGSCESDAETLVFIVPNEDVDSIMYFCDSYSSQTQNRQAAIS